MQQHISPNTSVLDGPGWCLRHTQSVYGLTGAPFWHESAWKAWEATEYKHTSRTMPNASVPVWFSHFGTYGAPARYDNFGHVVAYVPGRGFLSSPAWVRPGQTVGQLWLDSIEAVERTFNAKFVGWSEDLNATRIITASGNGSGGTGVDMTPEESKRLEQVEVDVAWIKNRMAGSLKNDSITALLVKILAAADWSKRRLGGSNKDDSITQIINAAYTSSAEEFAAAVVEEMGEVRARDIAAQLIITTKED